jgi:hypothetical protein
LLNERSLTFKYSATPHLRSVDEHDGLPAGAARRRSQTAGHVVEADFRALNLAAGLIETRALVNGTVALRLNMRHPI